MIPLIHVINIMFSCKNQRGPFFSLQKLKGIYLFIVFYFHFLGIIILK
jgi:hypothetical protein